MTQLLADLLTVIGFGLMALSVLVGGYMLLLLVRGGWNAVRDEWADEDAAAGIADRTRLGPRVLLSERDIRESIERRRR